MNTTSAPNKTISTHHWHNKLQKRQLFQHHTSSSLTTTTYSNARTAVQTTHGDKYYNLSAGRINCQTIHTIHSRAKLTAIKIHTTYKVDTATPVQPKNQIC